MADFTLYDGLITGGLAVVAFLAMRSDRTKNIAEATTVLLKPLKNRIDALEAEISGLHEQVEHLEAENRSLKGQITRLRNTNAELRLLLLEAGIPPPKDASNGG